MGKLVLHRSWQNLINWKHRLGVLLLLFFLPFFFFFYLQWFEWQAPWKVWKCIHKPDFLIKTIASPEGCFQLQPLEAPTCITQICQLVLEPENCCFKCYSTGKSPLCTCCQKNDSLIYAMLKLHYRAIQAGS